MAEAQHAKSLVHCRGVSIACWMCITAHQWSSAPQDPRRLRSAPVERWHWQRQWQEEHSPTGLGRGVRRCITNSGLRIGVQEQWTTWHASGTTWRVVGAVGLAAPEELQAPGRGKVCCGGEGCLWPVFPWPLRGCWLTTWCAGGVMWCTTGTVELGALKELRALDCSEVHCGGKERLQPTFYTAATATWHLDGHA